MPEIDQTAQRIEPQNDHRNALSRLWASAKRAPASAQVAFAIVALVTSALISLQISNFQADKMLETLSVVLIVFVVFYIALLMFADIAVTAKNIVGIVFALLLSYILYAKPAFLARGAERVAQTYALLLNERIGEPVSGAPQLAATVSSNELTIWQGNWRGRIEAQNPSNVGYDVSIFIPQNAVALAAAGQTFQVAFHASPDARNPPPWNTSVTASLPGSINGGILTLDHGSQTYTNLVIDTARRDILTGTTQENGASRSSLRLQRQLP